MTMTTLWLTKSQLEAADANLGRRDNAASRSSSFPGAVNRYNSEEGMDERMSRLETRLSALETAHGALKARVDEFDRNILWGEIAYFIDKLAATAAYGFYSGCDRKKIVFKGRSRALKIRS